MKNEDRQATSLEKCDNQFHPPIAVQKCSNQPTPPRASRGLSRLSAKSRSVTAALQLAALICRNYTFWLDGWRQMRGRHAQLWSVAFFTPINPLLALGFQRHLCAHDLPPLHSANLPPLHSANLPPLHSANLPPLHSANLPPLHSVGRCKTCADALEVRAL
jgi:hypothetical protein